MSDGFDPTTFSAVRRGNRYEDFHVGQEFWHHWGRTLTTTDNTIFSSATCNWNPMYGNAEFARTHGHPDAVLNPMLVLCTVIGMSVEDLSEAGGPFLGVERCQFRRPVYPGETITARSTVVAMRESKSRPTSGTVTWHTEAYNERDELILEYDRTNLIAKRGSPA
jgi:itaconyl-CoA hydratase